MIRGNISEIKALVAGSGSTKGVDADVADAVTEENLNEAVAFAKAAAARYHTIVAITGAIDLVADENHCYVIRNGRPEMGRITGTGCQLSGLLTAYLTANPGNELEAAAAAVSSMVLQVRSVGAIWHQPMATRPTAIASLMRSIRWTQKP